LPPSPIPLLRRVPNEMRPWCTSHKKAREKV
jgi:hypothetical protein